MLTGLFGFVTSVRFALDDQLARPQQVALGGPVHVTPAGVLRTVPNVSVAVVLI
jgi:hypothetical protein